MSGTPGLRIAAFAGMFALGLAIVPAAQRTPSDDLVAEGRRLYREGRSGSGRDVSAFVQGDVPVLGSQMTCQSCHGRSGMGTIEGGRIPAAVAGPLLFSQDAQRRRPAYTDRTLARALREGIDPAGRPIDPLMPRFRLEDRELAALTAYLRQLGVAASPGVGPSSLRVATLIAGDVAIGVERAMLDVIEAYVADRNRSGRQRLRGGHAPGQPKEPYREWTLDVWRVSGPPGSWRGQIDRQYRQRPVFALIGGVASDSWQPIHDFCEAEQMPCILPDADLPPPVDGGFYSLYFSRGLRLEAEIIAATLETERLASNVVAVVEGGRNSLSRAAAATLSLALERRGGRMRTLEADRGAGPDAAVTRAFREAGAIVLWLNADGIGHQAAAAGIVGGNAPIFLSSTLLAARWDAPPAGVRKRARVVHLSALPGEPDPALARFRIWARARALPVREERHQALAYFACLAFAEGTKHMAFYMVRDYLMDLLEHASNLTAYLPFYLRAGMTPGQRVLSRGGYVVDLSGRLKPVWLVP